MMPRNVPPRLGSTTGKSGEGYFTIRSTNFPTCYSGSSVTKNVDIISCVRKPLKRTCIGGSASRNGIPFRCNIRSYIPSLPKIALPVTRAMNGVIKYGNPVVVTIMIVIEIKTRTTKRPALGRWLLLWLLVVLLVPTWTPDLGPCSYGNNPLLFLTVNCSRSWWCIVAIISCHGYNNQGIRVIVGCMYVCIISRPKRYLSTIRVFTSIHVTSFFGSESSRGDFGKGAGVLIHVIQD